MGIKGAMINKICNLMPYSFLKNNYLKLSTSKLNDFTDGEYYNKFLKKSMLVRDFDAYIDQVEKNNKYCIIQQGAFEYKIINFCFVRDMISLMIWCLENGYKPLIEIYPSSDYYEEKSNLWEKMFIQPFGANLEEVKKSGNYIVCPINRFAVRVGMSDVRKPEMVSLWGKLLNKFMVFNDYCKDYVEKEYDSILAGKRVLACVLRGTDYTRTKPKGHPKQPTTDEVFEKIDTVIKENKIDYIYLATEEKAIADKFKQYYPNKILENKRMYFDEKYFSSGDENQKISEVHFDRKDDDFFKSLEYFSSINLVSKSTMLVSGLSGGSEMAIYLNGGKYEYCYLFDKGVY